MLNRNPETEAVAPLVEQLIAHEDATIMTALFYAVHAARLTNAAHHSVAEAMAEAVSGHLEPTLPEGPVNALVKSGLKRVDWMALAAAAIVAGRTERTGKR